MLEGGDLTTVQYVSILQSVEVIKSLIALFIYHVLCCFLGRGVEYSLRCEVPRP